jgi:pimeloyl-ACP methyl ester carboxylesterase
VNVVLHRENLDHIEDVISGLDRTPAIIGHSFGGLLAQILAGRGRSVATVAIDAAPFRGVLPLPISALKSAFPVLGNPLNRNKAVPLTYEQFRFAFANVVDEAEAKELHETFAVPAAGAPVPGSVGKPEPDRGEGRHRQPERGPSVDLGREGQHGAWSITKASYDQVDKRRDRGRPDPDRGHR